MHIYAFYNDLFISESATSICMCDTSFESLLNGLIGGKFI